MADGTGIEWTDATWNPLRGCSRISAGCQNCYAERLAARFCKPGEAYEGLIHASTRGWNGNVRLVPEALSQPVRWQRPRRIFVNSTSDLFHEAVPFEYIAAVFGVMAATPRHTYQVLTKRPARALEWFQWHAEQCKRLGPDSLQQWRICENEAIEHVEELPAIGCQSAWPLENVWLGVSVENQSTADQRIPLLLQCPATVRWLSCEPLIGPVNVRGYLMQGKDPGRCANCRKGHGFTRCPNYGGIAKQRAEFDGGPILCTEFRRASFAIDWIVAGGESGPGARPMHAIWARHLRDQCADTCVPFLFKQWGEWGTDDKQRFRRVGKKAAGRLLDGVLHDAYPTQRGTIER